MLSDTEKGKSFGRGYNKENDSKYLKIKINGSLRDNILDQLVLNVFDSAASHMPYLE